MVTQSQPTKDVTTAGEDLPEVGAEQHQRELLKRYGVLGASVLLVIIGLFFIWSALNRPDGPVPMPGRTAFEQTGDPTQREDTWVFDIPRNDALIRMNGGTYIPDNLTVEVGMTIAFANEDEKQDYWPASSTHPGYFDLPSAIPPGAFYSFTITEVERVEFTDQLYPEVSGAITAREPQEQ